MRTRHDRATQLLLNCYDMGVGFRHEGDAVIALAPTFDGAGREHPALQAVLDRYQDILTQLVPRHGVQPDRLLPATVAGATDDSGDKMQLIRKGVESAAKSTAKKQAQRRQYRKPTPKRYSYMPVAIYEP